MTSTAQQSDTIYDKKTALAKARQVLLDNLNRCMQRTTPFTTADLVTDEVIDILHSTDEWYTFAREDLHAKAVVLGQEVIQYKKRTIRYAFNPTTRTVHRGGVTNNAVIWFGLTATPAHLPEGHIFVPGSVRPKYAPDWYDKEQAKGFEMQKPAPAPEPTEETQTEEKRPPRLHGELMELLGATLDYLDATRYTKPFDTIIENNEWTATRERLEKARHAAFEALRPDKEA